MKSPVAPGQMFGDLTVVSITAGRKNVHPFAECRCSCGALCVKRVSHLRLGKATKCRTCSWKAAWESRRPTDQVTGLNRAYHGYVSGAGRRGYSFELTREEVAKLLASECRYCGQPANRLARGRGRKGGANVSGIDRVDNRIGYTSTNCVPCCSTCNRAKAEMTLEQFLAWVDSVHRNMEAKQ